MRAFNKLQSPALMVVMMADFSVPAFGGTLEPQLKGDGGFLARRAAFVSVPGPSVLPADGTNIVPWRARKTPMASANDIRPL